MISADDLALDPQSAPAPLRSRWTGPDLKPQEQLVRVLAHHGGNITAAEHELGNPRSQLQRWLKNTRSIRAAGQIPRSEVEDPYEVGFWGETGQIYTRGRTEN